MSRQVGDERARYGRKSLREQLEDLFAWPAAHPVGTFVLLFFLVVGSLFFGSRALGVRFESLVVGDCLYVRTDAAQEELRPIGERAAVTQTLVAGGAERTDCGASHGHEVSAVVTVPLPSQAVGEIGEQLTADQIKALSDPLCDAAFEGYVGHALAGSRYTTYAVFPEPAAWVASDRRTVCLIARVDGAWMDHLARGRGE
jgi:hypothetical protein